VREKMTTQSFNLTELRAKFGNHQTELSNEILEITLDNKHDVSLIELLVHDDNEYFSFTNHATSLNESYWLSDDHTVTVSDNKDATTKNLSKLEGHDIDAIADQCSSLSSNEMIEVITKSFLSSEELLELINKLSALAIKVSKSENKQAVKANRPEKTQTTSTRRVSDKNFNYFNLLSSWYNSALSAREIAADIELSNGYGVATIAEDMRVIKVLLGGDKLIQVSKEWCDYIINYWSENSDTTWQRLHYAFSKDGRKCSDLDILCNYVIDNGVTKEDVKTAIASQIASQN
jgi:hypothetical protein